MEKRINRPHVLIMSEMTVDGKLTLWKGASSKILMQFMDPETEILLHKTRAEYDAIMVGSNTIRIDNSMLTVRHAKGSNPIRVIPNRGADIPLDSNVLGPDAQTVITVSEEAPQERVAALLKKGVDVLVAGKKEIDFSLLMTLLYDKYHVRSLMVEGGPTLNYYMLKNRLVDELRLIHLPFIVGGADTPSLVGGMHIRSVEEMFHLSLKNHYMCGKNLITEYDILYQ
ncbi:dihydrofolate reductase family protein [Methanogenium sp. MK-MG]|uniref:dihydrofolate reductase family protein n=1 Tax=Methanogenium sp. MK-MG TaxID=2599926 RepID=UPI0013EB7AC0|nr:dihydrofolate reductase family protein [Methanogenium sp. MK-MG]KAF1074493.1 2,5-diamino-6-ribosylamino-4(3H)-pyrimidinone 5'-phosphate reductase [Methanogenium sp. MK-MG]